MIVIIGVNKKLNIDLDLEFTIDEDIHNDITAQTSDQFPDIDPLYISDEIKQLIDSHIERRDGVETRVNKLQDQHGNTLPDCFLMPYKTTALDFAYKLHTDIGDNFIKAIDVKSKKPVGKDHLLKNRDVVEIATSK